MENFQATLARSSTLINPFLYNTPTGWIRRRFRRVPIARKPQNVHRGRPQRWPLYLPTFPFHECAGRVEILVTLPFPPPHLQQYFCAKVDSKLLLREVLRREEVRPNRPSTSSTRTSTGQEQWIEFSISIYILFSFSHSFFFGVFRILCCCDVNIVELSIVDDVGLLQGQRPGARARDCSRSAGAHRLFFGGPGQGHQKRCGKIGIIFVKFSKLIKTNFRRYQQKVLPVPDVKLLFFQKKIHGKFQRSDKPVFLSNILDY